MPKNFQDDSDSIFKEAILTVVRMADDRMLQESGNPIYLRMKAELDRLQPEPLSQ